MKKEIEIEIIFKTGKRFWQKHKAIIGLGEFQNMGEAIDNYRQKHNLQEAIIIKCPKK